MGVELSLYCRHTHRSDTDTHGAAVHSTLTRPGRRRRPAAPLGRRGEPRARHQGGREGPAQHTTHHLPPDVHMGTSHPVGNVDKHEQTQTKGYARPSDQKSLKIQCIVTAHELWSVVVSVVRVTHCSYVFASQRTCRRRGGPRDRALRRSADGSGTASVTAVRPLDPSSAWASSRARSGSGRAASGRRASPLSGMGPGAVSDTSGRCGRRKRRLRQYRRPLGIFTE